MLKRIFGVLACTVIMGGAFGDTFPSKPVRMIVAFPPGQATDIVARLLGEELTKTWGVQVVIDNRAGGNNIPGTVAGKIAPADGYTITFGTSSALAVNPSLYTKLPYDTAKDFAMVGGVFISPWLIVSNPSTPYNTLREMVATAKKNPNALTWGYGATALQLGAELFKYRAGIDIVGVPYKGSGPATVDLMGGQIMVGSNSVTGALPQIKAGKLKALAVDSPTRSALLPDVPTVAEAGVPGYEGGTYSLVVGPVAMPASAVNRLNAALNEVLRKPAVRERYTQLGLVPMPKTAAETADFVARETAKWAKVMKEANIQIQ